MPTCPTSNGKPIIMFGTQQPTISWCQFHQDCMTLSEAILQAGAKYDKIMCISRGGVFVGGMVAHMLKMRNLTTIALKLYDLEDKTTDVVELSSPDLPPPGARLLVVDDLLDSGRTYAYIHDKWADKYKIDFAVLYDKGGGEHRPTFCAAKIPNEWIWFPWENPDGV